MTNDYIRRQDVSDAVEESRRLNHHKDAKEACAHEYEHRHFLKILMDIEPADVVPVEILKAEIYKLKCQQDSKNQDYYTGYMSALSTVEGILAEMREE